MQQILTEFLKEHYNPNKPVLLGLSGGPDSLALLHLLREHKEVALAIAHVDHGWREESGGEAEQLRRMAEEMGLPFHLKKLDPTKLKGNLEAASRDERLNFFSDLCIDFGYQAVILGHQAEDQVETVLKRVLEGASLPYLGGLTKVKEIGILTIWRPLLEVSKETILAWLSQKKIISFNDSTNLDPKFLRGKFRTRILPLLSAEFGKDVYPSLQRVGADSHELRSYLDDRIEPLVQKAVKGKFGLALDLADQEPLPHHFELKYLIRQLCEKEGFFLSHGLLEKAADLLISGVGNKEISMGNHVIYIDRHRLYIVPRQWPDFSERIPLTIGTHFGGIWKVNVTQGPPIPPTSGWLNAWQGRLFIWLPNGEYELGPAVVSEAYPGESSLSKWWTNHKVPAFMRQKIPVIYQSNRIVGEFLTSQPPQFPLTERGLIVELSFGTSLAYNLHE